jgi:hypothetical protein
MSQGATALPATGTFTGLTEQGYINAALAALLTNNSGGTAPSSPSQWQTWLDTSVSNYGTLRIYDGTGWRALATLDLVNLVLGLQEGGGAQESIASASTTDLWSTNSVGAQVKITGTTTITKLTNASAIVGTRKKVTFGGILTLTHDATKLILPNGGNNIITAAGDSMEVTALTSTNVMVSNYVRASGQPINQASGRVLLNTLTPSAAASASDTTSITGTYREYELEFTGFSTSTGPLSLLLHGSGSFQTTGYDTFTGAPASSGGTTGATTTSIPLLPAGIANLNNATIALTIYGTAGGSFILGRSTYYYFASSIAYFGMSDIAAQFIGFTCDGFKVQPASGTLSGTVYVYGRN